VLRRSVRWSGCFCARSRLQSHPHQYHSLAQRHKGVPEFAKPAGTQRTRARSFRNSITTRQASGSDSRSVPDRPGSCGEAARESSYRLHAVRSRQAAARARLKFSAHFCRRGGSLPFRLVSRLRPLEVAISFSPSWTRMAASYTFPPRVLGRCPLNPIPLAPRVAILGATKTDSARNFQLSLTSLGTSQVILEATYAGDAQHWPGYARVGP